MRCSEGLARIAVFAANFAFWLVGIVLLYLGILYAIQFRQYGPAIPDEYQTIQYLPIYSVVVGAIIFFVAFLGCYGTLQSNTWMLTAYAAILIVIFILQVGLGLLALLHIKNEDDLRQQLDQRLNIVFSKYNQTAEVTCVVDLIQANLECCGTTSVKLWSSVGLDVPVSCYGNSQEAEQLFDPGCNKAVLQFIVSSVKLIATIAIAISATEVIGAVLALCLTNCIKSTRMKRELYY